MSHQNDSFPPSFSYIVEEPSYAFDCPVPELNVNVTPPWIPSGSHSVQHQVRSPSNSVRTALTAPDSSSFHRQNVHQAGRSPMDHNIDPNLPNFSLLTPSPYNPIARHLQDQPWSAGNLRSASAASGRNPFNHSNVQYGIYRGGPGSDIDSNVLASDSGYHSQPPPSVFSNEPSRKSQEMPSSITLKASNLNVKPNPSEAPATQRISSDQVSQASSRSGKSGKSFQCPDCGEMSKCKSDLKKHKLRHERPFRCDISNCKRIKNYGFTTINDLDRHKKSVHRIGLRTKSYQCASENCRNKEKIWPRLDNFKQHVERMHKDENELDLIKRSVYLPRESTPARAYQCASENCRNKERIWHRLDNFKQHVERMHRDENKLDLIKRSVCLPRESTPVRGDSTIRSIDTSLAVAGMEKSFSGSPAMGAGRTIDLSIDQDARRWPPLNQNPENFARTVYQISNQGNVHGLGDNVTRHRASEGAQGPFIYQRASGTIIRRNSQAVPSNVTIQALSENISADKQEKKALPSLSNAPQTKAEQQRSALQKLSHNVTEEIKSSPSVEPVNLEDLILGILYEATDSAELGGSPLQELSNPNSLITLTKDGVLKASQAISALIRQSTGSTYTLQRRVHPGSIFNAKVCPKCNYAVARDCDLRKHMKRHDKPYGCTYPHCHKHFGAKSDWKRHENSQHFQLEAFRCAQPSLSTLEPICSQHFFRLKDFEEHLRAQHKICEPEQLKDDVTNCKIGKNCQGRFWCGFCKVVTELKERRNAAWDERFDHIAHHFEKERKNIDEWVCVEENKTKKELLMGPDRYVLDDEEERDVDAVGEADDEIVTVSSNMMSEQCGVPKNPGPPNARLQSSQDMLSKKRPRADMEMQYPAKRRMEARTKLCCQCSGGPWRQPLHLSCMSCSHHLCGGCSEEVFDVVADY